MVDDFIAFLEAQGESRLAALVRANRVAFEAVSARVAVSAQATPPPIAPPPPRGIVFEVEPHNVASTIAAWAVLQKRGDKLGVHVDDLRIEPARRVQREVQVRADRGVYIGKMLDMTLHRVTALLPEVRLADWTWRGTLAPMKGGNLVHSLTAVAIPHVYRSTPNTCDHCGYLRDRKMLHIVQHSKTHEWRQIGSACVKDYTGHNLPSVNAFATLIDEMVKFDGEDERGGSASTYYGRDDVLALAAYFILSDGFVSRSAARERSAEATASRVRDVIEYPQHAESTEATQAVSSAHRQLADEVVRWAAAIPADTTNEYMHNVKVALAGEALTPRALGVAVSAVAVFLRERGNTQRQGAYTPRTNAFVGNVGDMLRAGSHKLTKAQRVSGVNVLPAPVVRLLDVREIITQYGDLYILRMVDAPGNVYVWKASKPRWHSALTPPEQDGINSAVFLPGMMLVLEGTIKEHSTYRDRNETIMARCSLRLLMSDRLYAGVRSADSRTARNMRWDHSTSNAAWLPDDTIAPEEGITI